VGKGPDFIPAHLLRQSLADLAYAVSPVEQVKSHEILFPRWKELYGSFRLLESAPDVALVYKYLTIWVYDGPHLSQLVIGQAAQLRQSATLPAFGGAIDDEKLLEQGSPEVSPAAGERQVTARLLQVLLSFDHIRSGARHFFLKPQRQRGLESVGAARSRRHWQMPSTSAVSHPQRTQAGANPQLNRDTSSERNRTCNEGYNCNSQRNYNGQRNCNGHDKSTGCWWVSEYG
jgi:hypothetical protein